MDLDAYLARIGWSGPVAIDAATLGALAAHHGRAIAFENLNPFLGLPVELDVTTLERKMVQGRRGGYCYEQNGLFHTALKALGFDASGLIARVLWGYSGDAPTPRGHMVQRVEIEGESWIVDVGFGGLTLTGALRLVPDIEQPTTLEPFRLRRIEEEWRLEARIGGTWRPLYQFDLQRQHYPIDYVSANYRVATHPASQFVTGLMLARPMADRRFALLNRDFAIHHLNGPTEKRRLETPAEFIDVLETCFDLRAGDLPRLERRLAELP
jgi:N-hydroxyarylamine O-acetyltransferase